MNKAVGAVLIVGFFAVPLMWIIIISIRAVLRLNLNDYFFLSIF